MGQIEDDADLFNSRPVTEEAIERLKGLCSDPGCQQIECMSVKCALEYIKQLEDLIVRRDNNG